MLNGVAVFMASILGSASGKYFSETYKALLNQVTGISTIVIGLTAITSSVANIPYQFFIMVLDLGQLVNIDRQLTQFYHRHISPKWEGKDW